MSSVRLIGDDLVELSVADSRAARAMAQALRDMGGFEEIVPAIEAVTVQFNPLEMRPQDVLARLKEIAAAPLSNEMTTPKIITIPVHYGGTGGPDLAMAAESAGLSTDEFIALHTSREYPVEMIGFTPGFAYLSGTDARVTVGRLDQPRSVVPAGSVGVIKGFTGIYALEGPGGWPIVGRTAAALFDAEAEEPFLLEPGISVRFEAV